MEQIKYKLELFVVDSTTSSMNARNALKDLISKRFVDRCYLQVIDILEDPQAAESNNIFATPTLVKSSPLPVKRVIGDLNNIERVIAELELN